ncbi:hypothetical protein Pfo_015050 [Paulownia fortunei]|nr:hypothetical protein Pfo_015050 [Paulownia fortunei]
MARLSLLFVLAAAVLALAAFSAQARKTSTFHIDAAAAPSSRIHIVHRHLPPSAIGKHGVHDATAPSGSKKQGHHAAALPGGKKQATHAAELSPDYQDFALPPEPYPGFYNCLEKLTEDCGVEIYGGIFGKDGVSSRCCGQLVGLGSAAIKGYWKQPLRCRSWRRQTGRRSRRGILKYGPTAF